MNLNTLNTEDATKTETFGGEALTSGAYAIKVIKCDKATTQNGATNLSFELSINGSTRYCTLWLTSVDKNTNAIVENEYDSRRLKQLLFLLKIEPSTLTEVAINGKDWLVNIPQIRGDVGVVIEVVPVGTKYNKTDYPKINIVSFYIINTMQTVVEFTNNKKAETVELESNKLKNKEYIYTSNTQNNSTPQQFNVDNQQMDSSSLPF